MEREQDGMVGTEWQCVNLERELIDFDYLSGVSFEGIQIEIWLAEYEGIGKYYSDPHFKLYYFERDEDREMFLLRWT